MQDDPQGRVWLITGCSSGFGRELALAAAAAGVGAAEVTKAIVPLMREQRSGTIVQMSSLGGRMTYPGLAGYDAAKHALEAFSEALSSELAPLGIRVLLVEPGMFRTKISSNMVLAPENHPCASAPRLDGMGGGPDADRPRLTSVPVRSGRPEAGSRSDLLSSAPASGAPRSSPRRRRSARSGRTTPATWRRRRGSPRR
ncbi:SDR family NAD(P)-dependent oxidoreductase [Microbispora rosea]|uniref:SDR family NAD(P)-dependent oxidoreductase n=1 Tax=Microbispora rosea TaxID=58117 RepID=UPI003D8C2331